MLLYVSSYFMTESELLDRLVLHVRTKNFDGFCSAVESGLITFGQKKLLYIMHNDLLKNINDCGEMEKFIAWAERFENV